MPGLATATMLSTPRLCPTEAAAPTMVEPFSITAGNSSGTNDAAAALTLADEEFARSAGLKMLGSVKAWASAAVEPRDTGLGAVKVTGKVLDRAGLAPGDVTLWEINEAFASVPIAAMPRVRAR
jgi:acetyl-CoA acetyltransferase